jgi:hypothetical protein
MTPGGLKGVAEKLVHDAYMDGFMIGSPTELLVRMCHQGKKAWASLPDRCKPGGLIKCQSPEKREKIKQLRAEHFNDRGPYC